MRTNLKHTAVSESLKSHRILASTSPNFDKNSAFELVQAPKINLRVITSLQEVALLNKAWLYRIDFILILPNRTPKVFASNSIINSK